MRYSLNMSNAIQIISKPNAHTETQVYNKAAQRIAEIMDLNGEYLVEYFKMGNAGQYVREMLTYRTETYACAFLAAKAYAVGGLE